jgi:hypothetical protein
MPNYKESYEQILEELGRVVPALVEPTYESFMKSGLLIFEKEGFF